LFLNTLIVFFDSGSFKTTPSAINAIEIAGKGLIGVSGSIQFISITAQERVEFFLGGIGLIIAISALANFLKPAKRSTILTQENEIKLRELLAQYQDADSLSYFALRENKNVIWSKNEKAAIPYTVTNGVMITTGDPLGDKESWPNAMGEFISESQKHAWIPAMYGCSEYAGEMWVRESKYDALEIGDEAVVDVKNFTLEGAEMKNVRQTINRIKRFEYTTKTEKLSEIDPEVRQRLSLHAQDWRGGTT
jgi:lysyl-tRNA synthetase class 2